MTAAPSLPHRRSELTETVRLALPMVLVQVGLMAMGTVDTIMVGHVSGDVLAAVALGNIYFFNVSIFGIGTLMALDPLVSQAVGAKDDASITRAAQRGAVLAVMISVVTSLLLLPSRRIFVAFHQPPGIVDDAANYLLISVPGVLPFSRSSSSGRRSRRSTVSLRSCGRSSSRT